MADGSCIKFNNATQRIFGDTTHAVVLVWEMNDRENPWSAEARLVVHSGTDLVLKVGQGSATEKQKAKDIAARSGFEWLRSKYPEIDLSSV